MGAIAGDPGEATGHQAAKQLILIGGDVHAVLQGHLPQPLQPGLQGLEGRWAAGAVHRFAGVHQRQQGADSPEAPHRPPQADGVEGQPHSGAGSRQGLQLLKGLGSCRDALAVVASQGHLTEHGQHRQGAPQAHLIQDRGEDVAFPSPEGGRLRDGIDQALIVQSNAHGAAQQQQVGAESAALGLAQLVLQTGFLNKLHMQINRGVKAPEGLDHRGGQLPGVIPLHPRKGG